MGAKVTFDPRNSEDAEGVEQLQLWPLPRRGEDLDELAYLDALPDPAPLFELKAGCMWIDGEDGARVQCCADVVNYKGRGREDKASPYCEEHYGQVYRIGTEPNRPEAIGASVDANMKANKYHRVNGGTWRKVTRWSNRRFAKKI
jgi:hypothetical protein